MGSARHAPGMGANRREKQSSERRAVCRYPVIIPDALLGWWTDTTFAQVPARIVNISTVGCWLETPETPNREETQSVWLRPVGIPTSEWAEANIVSIRKRFLGKCQIRIKFVAPLPFEAFKTLVYGPEHATQPEDRDLPDHERDYFWR